MQRPIINPNDLITDTTFYKWLTDQKNSGQNHVRFVDAILVYFGKPQPFKDRGDMNYHKGVFEAFWRNNLK